MWNYYGDSKVKNREKVIGGDSKAENEAIVIKPTKLSIKKIGKGTYRMQVNRGGATLFEAKGSNAQLACILRDRKYLPREVGSKSGFTYIDVVEDPDGSGVVDLYRRHVAPKDLGTPIPFKAEVVQSEQPASLDDDVEQITGLTDDLEGEVGAGNVAAKAKTEPEMVYDVVLRYSSGAYSYEVMESVNFIARNLPRHGVTVTPKSVDGVGREGSLRLTTRQDGTGVKRLIRDICSSYGLSEYNTPAEIDLTIVKQPATAAEQSVMSKDAQETYTVTLGFVDSSLVGERERATKRIINALSASSLNVGSIGGSPSYRQLTVMGRIDRGALEKLLEESRAGETKYETPTIKVSQ